MGEFVPQLSGWVASVAEVSFYMRGDNYGAYPVSPNLPTLSQLGLFSAASWAWLAMLF